MHLKTYILDDSGNPVLERDPQRFDEWFGRTENRVVGREDISPDVSVSTVFLGFDHNLSGRGPPVLWETISFGGHHDQYQERYTSKGAALKGHIAAVALAKGAAS